MDRRYRSSLFIEVWIALLLYGRGVLDDLPRLAARGLAHLFGWRAVPDPTTVGRWHCAPAFWGSSKTSSLEDCMWTKPVPHERFDGWQFSRVNNGSDPYTDNLSQYAGF